MVHKYYFNLQGEDPRKEIDLGLINFDGTEREIDDDLLSTEYTIERSRAMRNRCAIPVFKQGNEESYKSRITNDYRRLRKVDRTALNMTARWANGALSDLSIAI
ncbi:hypothetical protein J4463_03645 [Candidatus Pacearchaeota archaeon]|nr:hypothetical protein [Candidatus Pacearchaeota archaeon]